MVVVAVGTGARLGGSGETTRVRRAAMVDHEVHDQFDLAVRTAAQGASKSSMVPNPFMIAR